MKNNWLITFRSVTFAQKAERALNKAGIACTMRRTPRELSQRGCGYSLRLRGADALAAVLLLQEKQIGYRKTYAITQEGHIEEREL